MSGAFHSDRWYRVAHLAPSLRAQVRVHRHRYRGDVAYVLQDAASNRMLRFTQTSARLFNLMDGHRTVEDIWRILVADSSRAPPRQDEVIDLISRAHAFDLVQVDLPPEIAALAERRSKEKNQKLRTQVLNPLSIKLPVWDPDRFLSSSLGVVKPLFGWVGFGIWLLAVLFAVVQAGEHWADLTNNVHDRLLSLGNLALISLIYPIVKALHELGHGYAVKAHGGQVHEMGVMFIYLMPVPYVEASAANAFADKWQRVTVSAAGPLSTRSTNASSPARICASSGIHTTPSIERCSGTGTNTARATSASTTHAEIVTTLFRRPARRPSMNRNRIPFQSGLMNVDQHIVSASRTPTKKKSAASHAAIATATNNR